MLMDTITYATGADHFYDVAGSTLSTPADTDVVLRFRSPRAFKLPSGLTGSTFYAETAPSGSSAVFSIQKNDTQIGTLTFAASSNTATVSFGSEASFAVGDRLEIVCTTASGIDAVYFTFKTFAS